MLLGWEREHCLQGWGCLGLPGGLRDRLVDLQPLMYLQDESSVSPSCYSEIGRMQSSWGQPV